MTKPFPVGFIKKQKTNSNLREFNLLIGNITPEDKIGNLSIVNIQFDIKRPDKKKFLFKESYSPTFEKNKCLDPSERLIFQLIETMQKMTREVLIFTNIKKNTRNNEKKLHFTIC